MPDIDDAVFSYFAQRDDFEEAARITTYKVYINNQPVTVNVYDRGPDAEGIRWSVEAFASDLDLADRHTGNSNYTLGNAERTLELALDGPHWWIFEQD